MALDVVKNSLNLTFPDMYEPLLERVNRLGYSWVSYDVAEVTGVNSKTKHSYQIESIVRFMY
jgi:hypothetical protein